MIAMITALSTIHATHHASRNGMPRMVGSTRLTKNGPISMAANGKSASKPIMRI